MIIPLFGRGYSSKSTNVTAELLLNMYREPAADKTTMALYNTPGLTTHCTAAALPRGMYTMGSYVYVVAADKLYRFDSAGTLSASLGTLSTSSGRVSMADNGTQLMIVDGSFGYTYTPGTATFAKILDADFVAGNTVTYLSGYFIVDNPSGRFRWSALLDGTSWASLDFATAESSPDALVAVKAMGGELYLFGSLTTEIWAPSGDSAIFRRVGGSGVAWGLTSAATLDVFRDGLVFLGRQNSGDARPVVMRGFSVTPIDTPDVANAISTSFSQLPTGSGFSYQLDGHTFYQLSMAAGGGKSYLYDDLTQSWSKTRSFDISPSRHYAECAALMAGVMYVSDYRSGLGNGPIYRIDPLVYTEGGNPVSRQVTTQHVSHDYDRLKIWELQLDVEPVVGGYVALEVSKDGGHTFASISTVIVDSTLGNTYKSRAVWRRLGWARDWVFRFTFAGGTTKVAVLGGGIKV